MPTEVLDTETPMSVQEMVEASAEEARNATIEDAASEEVSTGDTEAGSGELSDEGSGEAVQALEEKVTSQKGSHFVAMRNGEEVEIPDDLLDLEFSFKSNGEERTSKLESLIRKVQQADGLDAQVKQLTEQRNETAREADQRAQEMQKLSANSELLTNILRDETGESFRKVQEAYKQQGGSTVSNPNQNADIPRQDPRVRQAQLQAVSQVIVPHARELAEAYGADPREVGQSILTQIQATPTRFLTPEIVADVMNKSVPSMLEKAGYEASREWNQFDSTVLTQAPGVRPSITPKEQRVTASTESEMKSEIKELKAQLAAQSSKSKLGKAPPPAGSGATPDPSTGGSELSETFSNAESAADVLEGLRELRGL